MAITIQADDLALPVARLLNKPGIEIVDWHVDPLSAGGSERAAGGLGIHRVTGIAQEQGAIHPWSMILKGASGKGTGSNEADAWNYWKREAMVYRSGILEDLPGGVSAPRCYGIQEHPDEIVWLWLEDMGSPSTEWSMARHGLAARHLGQFNGAYLTGHPLPQAEPWMTWGRTRQWSNFGQPFAERSHQYADTTLAQRWFGQDGLERTLQLWAQHQQLLQLFEQLPICYCHHDAFRRNLIDRQPNDNHSETVLIDWAITGFGRIGEEIGAMLCSDLAFLDVPANQAHELDQTIFAGYVDGLRDAGWQGDPRLARLGYTVNALLITTLTWNLVHLEWLQQPENVSSTEAIIGYPIDAILAQWTEALPFLLDRGDEACRLMQEVRV